MKFRILEVKVDKKPKYKVYYFDEFNNRGQQWNQVLFENRSYADTIEEAEYQASLFYEGWIKENGRIIEEFEY